MMSFGFSHKLTQVGVSDAHVALQEVVHLLYRLLLKFCRLGNKTHLSCFHPLCVEVLGSFDAASEELRRYLTQRVSRFGRCCSDIKLYDSTLENKRNSPRPPL